MIFFFIKSEAAYYCFVSLDNILSAISHSVAMLLVFSKLMSCILFSEPIDNMAATSVQYK